MLSDAEAIYAQAASAWDQEKIIVYGRSLGSSFACHVSNEFSPGQLILEAPFYSTADVARAYAWMYPINAMLKFNFKNFMTLSGTKCPITIFHGNNDLVVPISSGRKLEQTGKDVKFIEIDNGRHNNLSDFKIYWEELERVLD